MGEVICGNCKETFSRGDSFLVPGTTLYVCPECRAVYERLIEEKRESGMRKIVFGGEKNE